MLSETTRLSHLLAHLDAADGRTVGRLEPWTLSSHFQPIYSLSHGRVVGHEALLRAAGPDGRFVPPPEVFKSCRSNDELATCDSVSRLTHLRNFITQGPQSQWVFLNIHPEVFQRLARQPDGGEGYLRAVSERVGVPGECMVLEVLETDISDLPAMETAMAAARRHGCLIAIDDFGAGQSNFDRVWRMQPDIVKLDRNLIAQAAQDRRTQRVVSQMASLLHECGAMVLMEGVETIEEAYIAMESDADMVQGYYFGRPQPALVPNDHAPASISSLYPGLGDRRERQRHDHRIKLAPYQHAIGNAGVLMSAGVSAEDACRDFLALTGADIAYVLDADGYQIGTHLHPPGRSTAPRAGFEPLARSDGACWARRPYFRRATEAIGKVQTTRPYRTLHGKLVCVTVSYAYHHLENGRRELRVVCGDMEWHESAPEAGGPP
ncbi:MAG: EAL domain-containing protein [Rhizobacter sp.]